jgi:hypothetical protein
MRRFAVFLPLAIELLGIGVLSVHPPAVAQEVTPAADAMMPEVSASS